MPIRTLIVMGFAIGFLYLLFTVGAPFLLALVAVVFLEPLNAFLMDKARLNRLSATILTSTLFSVALLGVLALIGMKVVSELRDFLGKLPGIFRNMNNYIRDVLERVQRATNGDGDPLPDQLEEWLSNVTDTLAALSTKASDFLVGIAVKVPNLFIFLIIFLVAVYLFSMSLPLMKKSFLSVFEEKSRDQMAEVLESLRKSVFGFLRAQFLLSLITYILSFVGLLIIGTGYPLAIALLIVVVDILPILGTGSVLVPWAVYQLALGDPFTGIGLLLLFIVITVVRRIIEPKILGDSVGIGALAALISLYVGFQLVGVVGVFLGPIVVIVFAAMRKAGLFEFKIKLQ